VTDSALTLTVAETKRTRRSRPKASGNGRRPTKTRDICILGYAEETRDLVHGLHEDVEIWGINMAHAFLDRPAHYWFQMHPRGWKTSGGTATGFFGRPKEHFEFLQKFDGTVWLSDVDPEIPNSQRYPVEEVEALFGRRYLTSTFAYQFALALKEHLEGKTIRNFWIYGVNLTALEEYAHQRPCGEYWLGRMEQAGITVHVPPASALLKGPRYPEVDNELAAHAYERLQHWKSNYNVAWANVNTSAAMQTELEHWAEFLGKMEENEPESFKSEAQVAIQERLNKRNTSFTEMKQRYMADLNGALGIVKDCQHFLVLLGGVDFKAGSLPELRVPHPQLRDDFDLPSEMSRI